MAATHLAYPNLALDKFSGTDPDQDAESFIELIERRINFAVGDAPANPDELANYTFRKRHYFLHYSGEQKPNGTKVTTKLLPPGTTLEQVLLRDFQMAGRNFAIGWK